MTTRGEAPVVETRRRRPPDRRQLIIVAAARAFSDGGYHAVRLDEIADAAGISTPALYRHFPNKYALFAETTAWLADRLRSAIGEASPDRPDDLRWLAAALTAVAIENRRTGGLYRWEARYLNADDGAYVRAVVVNQHRRIRATVTQLRPQLDPADADLITAAMTSVVASPATHRAAMPAADIESLLCDAVMTLADLDLPAPTASATPPLRGLAPSAKREMILAESIVLFAAHGFHDVSIDDIGRASGIPASGVYRHFESKAAILDAAFHRAADRMTASIADALAASSTPAQAITELVRRYVELCCANPELITVWTTESGHVEPGQRTLLRNRQRINVEEWANWVVAERDGITPTQARFLVHAALNVITDLIRLPAPPDPARVTALGKRILLGR